MIISPKYSPTRPTNNDPLKQDSFRCAKKTLSGDQVYFTGKPEKLNEYIPDNISAKKSLSLFDKLSNSSYLDVPQNDWFDGKEIDYKTIRRNNLSFLDKLTDEKEQAKFVKEYNIITGFPNLKAVSNKIIDDLVRAATVSAMDDYSEKQVVGICFNQTCSVGKGTALPGSDIDGAVIILKGSDNPVLDNYTVNEFSNKLWNSNDARILSFNHHSAFPQVYTISQLKYLNKSLECKVNSSMKLRLKEVAKLNNSNPYNPDYVEANKLPIEIISKFPDNKLKSFTNPSREQIKNYMFAAETIESGRNIVVDPLMKYYYSSGKCSEEECYKGVRNYRNFRKKLKKSAFSDVFIPSQIKVLDKMKDDKEKVKLRRNIEKDFPSWSIKKQFSFIKNMIKASCGENDDARFAKYFKPGQDRFTPLLKALKNA